MIFVFFFFNNNPFNNRWLLNIHNLGWLLHHNLLNRWLYHNIPTRCCLIVVSTVRIVLIPIHYDRL